MACLIHYTFVQTSMLPTTFHIISLSLYVFDYCVINPSFLGYKKFLRRVWHASSFCVNLYKLKRCGKFSCLLENMLKYFVLTLH